MYKIDSTLNWFYVPIGVWVLIWAEMFSFAQIALSMSISLLWSTILELPSGALADLVGRKKTVILGRIMLVLGYILLFWRHDFVGFIVWQMLYQTDSAFSSGAQSALLYDSLKENKKEEQYYKKTEADAFMFCTFGMAVASVLGGYLYKHDPFLPYSIMIPVTVIGLLASLVYEEPVIDSQKWTVKNYVRQNVDGVMHIFQNQQIRLVSFFSIAVTLVTYAGVWYLYEPRLAQGGFDPRIMAWLVAGTYFVRGVGTRLVRWIDRTVGEKNTPLFLTVSQTLFSVISFLSGKITAITTVYGRKLVDGYRQPIVLELQNKEIESRYRATSLSALNLLTNLVLAGLGIFIGKGIDYFGASTTLGLFSLWGLLIVLPLSLRLRKQNRL